MPSTTGALVPLSAFTHYEPANTTLAVNHQGQYPSVTASFNLVPGASLGDAVKAVEDAARKLGLPGNIRGSFSGTAQAMGAGQKGKTKKPCTGRRRGVRSRFHFCYNKDIEEAANIRVEM